MHRSFLFVCLFACLSCTYSAVCSSESVGQNVAKLLNLIWQVRTQWPPGIKAWVCGRSLADVADSNPAGVMDVCCVFCQAEVSASGRSRVQRSLTEWGVSECDREASLMRRPCPTEGCCATEKRKWPDLDVEGVVSGLHWGRTRHFPGSIEKRREQLNTGPFKHERLIIFEKLIVNQSAFLMLVNCLLPCLWHPVWLTFVKFFRLLPGCADR
jgi:hypothetical protein